MLPLIMNKYSKNRGNYLMYNLKSYIIDNYKRKIIKTIFIVFVKNYLLLQIKIHFRNFC